jgi:ankyrin repeat protein
MKLRYSEIFQTCAILALEIVFVGCEQPESPVRTSLEPPENVSWRLHALVHNGDLDGVRRAIADGADVNALETDQWYQTDHDMGVPSFTPLQVAVWDGHVDIARYLIAKGADPHISTPYVPGLLELALHRENLELVAVLLDAAVSADFVLQIENWAGETPLTLAYKEDNSALYSTLVEHGADVNYPNARGFNVLSIAALAGEIDELDALLRLGADVNAAIPTPPLHAAAYAGQMATVRFLLEHGAKPNAFASGGHVLLAAARGGHTDVIRILIEGGASVEARDEKGRTVLTAAEMSGSPDDMLAILLNYAQTGADLGNRDTPERMAIRRGLHDTAVTFAKGNDAVLDEKLAETSLLYYALEHGQMDIAESLVELGANVDLVAESGEPLLTTLPSKRDVQPDVFRFLVEHGADLTVRDRRGYTLATRCFWQFKPIDLIHIKTLIEQDLDLDVLNVDSTTTLALAVRTGEADLVRILLDGGADPNLSGAHGRTPLFDAVFQNEPDIVSLLIERGADVDAKDDYGATPLSEAAALGNEGVSRRLLTQGAQVNSRQAYGQTPLLRAVGGRAKDDPAIISLLLEHGADVAARSDGGETVVIVAAVMAKPETISVLADKGADVTAVDRRGKTAIMHAARAGKYDSIQILAELGCPINAKDTDGRAALHWAMQGYSEHLDWCEQEFESSDRNQRVRDDLERRFVRTVESLLAAGADANVADPDGDIPVKSAERVGLFDAANMLRAASHDVGLE